MTLARHKSLRCCELPSFGLERCVLCGARERNCDDRIIVCRWCGARWFETVHPARPSFAAGAFVASPQRCGGLMLDDYTARMAATGSCLRFVPAKNPVVLGHDEAPARGTLRPMRRRRPKEISLAVLSRPDDPNLSQLLSTVAPQFGETIVVVDGDVVEAPMWAPRSTRFIASPLESYAEQRNVAQEAARLPFVFHLDTDEMVLGLDTLPALVDIAEDGELDAIALRRLNLVDGILSDLFPDNQYRLVRRSVRFEGNVHERPDACRNWPRTMIALSATLKHHLTQDRLARRAARYRSMGEAPERAEEALALSRPFRP